MWSQYLRLWRDSWSRLRAKLETSYAEKPASARKRCVSSKRTACSSSGSSESWPRCGAHAEPRARVDRELIARQVPRPERHGRRQLAPPGLRGLAGQAEDEVDRDGVEACGLRGFDRGPRLRPRRDGGRGSGERRRRRTAPRGRGFAPRAPARRRTRRASRPRGWPPGRSRAPAPRTPGARGTRPARARGPRAAAARAFPRRSTPCRRAAGLPTRARRGAPRPPGARRSACARGRPPSGPRSRSTGRSPSRTECGGRAREPRAGQAAPLGLRASAPLQGRAIPPGEVRGRFVGARQEREQ